VFLFVLTAYNILLCGRKNMPRPLQVMTCRLSRSADAFWATALNGLVTLTFNLWRHCASRWCDSSYSISVPSLKFVGLPVPKIWPIFGHGVKQHGDVDLWPFGF